MVFSPGHQRFLLETNYIPSTVWKCIWDIVKWTIYLLPGKFGAIPHQNKTDEQNTQQFDFFHWKNHIYNTCYENNYIGETHILFGWTRKKFRKHIL